jgi:hypothetical protein
MKNDFFKISFHQNKTMRLIRYGPSEKGGNFLPAFFNAHDFLLNSGSTNHFATKAPTNSFLLILDYHHLRGLDGDRNGIAHGQLHLIDRLPGNGGP